MFCKNLLIPLHVCFLVHATLASLKNRVPNPGASEILPETREFIKKLEQATSVQDIKKLQEEDDTFAVHDFGESLPQEKTQPKKAAQQSCQPPSKDNAGSSSTDANNDVPTDDKSTSGGASDAASNEPSPEPDGGNGAEKAAVQEAVVSDADLTETDDGSSDEADETLELIDFGKSSDVAERAGSAGYDQVRVDRSSLASSVERQLQEPTTERPAPSGTKGGKQKRKKKYTEPPAPTAEELEATYKYEVLAPPDNSPVKLDFPASPQSQGEEHLSKHVPLTLYCDTCMAIAYQVHLSFAKFHSQVTRRPPTESEIYHLVSEACEHQRFREYGMLEVHGHRHISGPGCNQLEAEGGVKHSRGPWPRRLADRCEEVTEDIGEINMHNAWLEEQRDPERFKMYMCFGDPPRNYCQKYGHMDAAAEAAARERSRKPEDTETPIETANRLAREAEEAEKKRLAELDDSEQKDEL